MSEEKFTKVDRIDYRGIHPAYLDKLNKPREAVKRDSLDMQIGGSHYKTSGMQPIEYILANDLSWCEGNIVKYITRHAKKGNKDDIKKAIHYALILLEQTYKADLKEELKEFFEYAK